MKVKVLALKEEYKEYETRPMMTSPKKVYNLISEMMKNLEQEVFVMLSLNTKNGVKTIRTISIGSINANIVHPREVFRAAIFDAATSIIVAHNHPSGDPTPSREDIEITKKLMESGKLIGIEVLDHVIIGDGRHYSLKESGHMEM
jgi:DNA repair protein RadC